MLVDWTCLGLVYTGTAFWKYSPVVSSSSKKKQNCKVLNFKLCLRIMVIIITLNNSATAFYAFQFRIISHTAAAVTVSCYNYVYYVCIERKLLCFAAPAGGRWQGKRKSGELWHTSK